MSSADSMDESTYSAFPALPPPAPVQMVTPPDRPCVYLPGRQATIRAFYAPRIPPQLYHDFMDAGFRRAGAIVYQPICRTCRACMAIRVPVEEFRESKALRRCRRRNQDVRVEVAQPKLTDEKTRLYARYLQVRHNAGTEEEDAQSLESFLYQSPVATIEFTYRGPNDQLLAIGICDVCPQSLSSVYFFYDPAEHRRGLGNFGSLMEIDYCRRMKIPYWYIGYWVKGCRSMEYKANFHPHELLHGDGVWRPAENSDRA